MHFDPRNLAKLYLAHDGDYLEVAFADVRLPLVSLWEVQAAARHLHLVRQKSVNSTLLIEAIEIQREIVRGAQAKIHKMRRQQQAAQRGPKASSFDPLIDSPVETSATEIDWSKPAEPCEGEVW